MLMQSGRINEARQLKQELDSMMFGLPTPNPTYNKSTDEGNKRP